MRMYKVHRKHIQDLGLRPEHVEIMAAHLRSSLVDIGIKPEIIGPAVETMLKQKWIFDSSAGFEEQMQAMERERESAAQQPELQQQQQQAEK